MRRTCVKQTPSASGSCYAFACLEDRNDVVVRDSDQESDTFLGTNADLTRNWDGICNNFPEPALDRPAICGTAPNQARHPNTTRFTCAIQAPNPHDTRLRPRGSIRTLVVARLRSWHPIRALFDTLSYVRHAEMICVCGTSSKKTTL